MGNALAYVVVVDGRIAGTWRRTFAKQTVRIQLTPFQKLSGAEQRAVVAVATRFTRFVGHEHVLNLDIA